MIRELENQIILITGASRGIGRATAIKCANAGARVVLHAREKPHLEQVIDEIQANKGEFDVITFDVKDDKAIARGFETILRTHGRLDGCVNNAGIMVEGLLGMTSSVSVQEVLTSNLQSVITSMQYAARLMKRKGKGAIVNLSSIMGLHGSPGLVAYSASKAGVIGASLSAAKELAADGIRVNVVAPGFITTDMTAGLTPEQQANRISQIRMGRAGLPEEVAEAILFLLSDRASYISGQILGVDGLMSV